MPASARRTARSLLLFTLALVWMPSPAAAQTRSVTYSLENVWLNPDVSGGAPRQMTGTFVWTYDEGDFENGSGEFIAVGLPWYSLGFQHLGFTIETSSLEITLNGNYHDLGVDVSMFFLEPLSSDHDSAIDLDRSAFDIQQGVSHQGHFIAGRAVIVDPGCVADLNDDGVLDLLDVSTFAQAFLAGDSAADLASPFSVLDLSDIQRFVELFVAGCHAG